MERRNHHAGFLPGIPRGIVKALGPHLRLIEAVFHVVVVHGVIGILAEGDGKRQKEGEDRKLETHRSSSLHSFTREYTCLASGSREDDDEEKILVVGRGSRCDAGLSLSDPRASREPNAAVP